MSSELCSKVAIDQCESGCFFASIMLLFIKLKFLYNAFDEETRTYIDKVKSCPKNKGVCERPPRKVFTLYKKEYGDKLDVENGGSSVVLFESMLEANNITYSIKDVKDNINDLTNTDEKIWIMHTKIQIIPFYLKGSKSISMNNYKKTIQVIEQMAEKLKIVGGFIAIQRDKEGKHADHAIAFTMCKLKSGRYKVNMCTWGKCDSSGNSHKKLGIDVYTSIEQLTLLRYDPSVDELKLHDKVKSFFKGTETGIETVIKLSPLTFRDDKLEESAHILYDTHMEKVSVKPKLKKKSVKSKEYEEVNKSKTTKLPSKYTNRLTIEAITSDTEQKILIKTLLEHYTCQLDKNKSFRCLKKPHKSFIFSEI